MSVIAVLAQVSPTRALQEERSRVVSFLVICTFISLSLVHPEILTLERSFLLQMSLSRLGLGEQSSSRSTLYPTLSSWSAGVSARESSERLFFVR